MKRYGITSTHTKESPKGDWVRYSDYEALALKLAASEARAERWKAIAVMARESMSGAYDVIVLATGETWASTFEAALAADSAETEGK